MFQLIKPSCAAKYNSNCAALVIFIKNLEVEKLTGLPYY